MTFNGFLGLVAIVVAIFGIAFLIAPSQLVALYGVSLTPAAIVVGRIAGSAIVSLAIIFWGCRNQHAAELVKAVLLAGFIGNGLDCLIMLQATRGGVVNSLGWVQAAVNGLLAVGFAYYAFGRTASTPSVGRI